MQPQNAQTFELLGSIDSVEKRWNQADSDWKKALKLYQEQHNTEKVKKIGKTLSRLERLLKERSSQNNGS
jgi:hypothetical protein